MAICREENSKEPEIPVYVKERIERLLKEKSERQSLIVQSQEWITRDMELLRDPSVGVGRRDQLEMNVEGCKDAIKQSQQLIEVIKLILHYKPRREFEPSPSRQETITPKGGEINLKDEIGATLSIPRNSTAKDEQVNFTTGFSGSCEMPDGVESVSPAYLIETTNEVEFHEPVDVTLQHTSNLQTTEDCKEMMFLEASITSTAHKDSDSRLKFEEIDNASAAVKFSPGERHGGLKLKKLSSWFKIGRKQSGKKKERFYSARLYKAVTGSKVTAIFCMCLEHPLYTKHCDNVIPLEYPHRAKEKTIFNQVIITSDKVDLVLGETNSWTLFMNRSEIIKTEVDRPEYTKIKFSELIDYPPRIVIDLTPTKQASAPAVLDVMGLKDKRCFRIANDCVPNLLAEVNTQLLQDATKEVKTRISEDMISDSPMVTCARDMVRIMTEVEQLVHDPSSINELVKKVVEIQEQIKNVIRLSKGVNDVENSATKVSMLSHQFRTLAPVMQRCSAGNPELWPGSVEILVTNATILMKAIAELLMATEIAAVTERTRYYSVGSCDPNSPHSRAPPHQSMTLPSRLLTFSPSHYQGTHCHSFGSPLHFQGVKDKDVGFLMGHLCQHSFKWEAIGTALHFLPGELENIKHNLQDVQQRLNAVLCQWVQWPTTAHPQTPTMEMLRDALRSDLVGLGAVANKLYDIRHTLL